MLDTAGNNPKIIAAFEFLDTDDIALENVLRMLADAGAPVLFLDPRRTGNDAKAPWDVRTEGMKRYDRGRGLDAEGIHLATAHLDRLLKSYEHARELLGGADPNIAIDVARSGLILVDCDQAEQVAEVQQLATAGTDTDPATYTPTTRSPGMVDHEGQWRHKGGGHFMFFDDLGVDRHRGQIVLDGGTAIYLKSRYVLIPPSRRSEGPYEVIGPVRKLSEAPWLAEIIGASAQRDQEIVAENERLAAQRAERREAMLAANPGARTLDDWNDEHPWAELLTAAGWQHSGTDTSCGCPKWYIPGHASRKSATAHEPGCRHPSVTIVGESGPLNVWTSDPPDELAAWFDAHPSTAAFRRVSKSQFVCATRHGGSWAAFLAAEGFPDTTPMRDVGEYALDAPAAEVVVDAAGEAFWNAHPTLQYIREIAAVRGAGPWGVLGAVCAKLCVQIPPHVVLPAIVGSRSPVNLFVGVVGSAGRGKGNASDIAEELTRTWSPCPTPPMPTGEGLVRAMGMRRGGAAGRRDKTTYKLTDRLFVDIREIDSLYAVGFNRSGSTISAIMRSAWSGELLGFGYADNEKAPQIPSRSYRLAVMLGIQPALAGKLLGESGGGLPQRFLFVSGKPEDLPDEELEALYLTHGGPATPIDLSHLPDMYPARDPIVPARRNTGEGEGEDGDEDETEFGMPFDQIRYEDQVEVVVHEKAYAEIRAEHRRRSRLPLDYIETPEEALNSHRLLGRLRLAAVLGVLIGERAGVTDEVWNLAGTVYEHHDAMIGLMRRVVSHVAAEEARGRGTTQGRVNLAAQEVADKALEKRIAAAEKRLAELFDDARDVEDGWVAKRTIERAFRGAVREHILALLDDDALFEHREVVVSGRTRQQWRRVPQPR